MKVSNFLFIFLFILLVLDSCKIEKRVYLKGYHVEWRIHPGLNKLVNEVRATETNPGICVAELSDEHTIDIDSVSNNSASNFTPEIVTDDEEPSIEQIQTIKSKRKSSFKSEFNSGVSKILNSTQPKKTVSIAVTGFISAVMGIFFYAIVLGTLAVIFGILGMIKIKEEPDKLKGKGFAVAAIVIGIVDIMIWMMIVSML